MIQKLFDQLKHYQSIDPQQSQTIAQFLNFLETHKDFAFTRENKEGHFTASAWLLSPDRHQVLMMHHKKLNLWVQPGGHADGDANLHRVAQKEAQEESGISPVELESEEIFDIDRHEIPARKTEPTHFHYDVRFLARAPHLKFEQNEESHELKWLNSNDSFFSTEAEPSVRRMHQKWMQRLPLLIK